MRLSALVVTLAAVAGAAGLAGCGAGGPSLSASVFHLRVGDCLVPPTKVTAQLSHVSVVSCRQPHTQQVFALVDDRNSGTYPGVAVLQNFAQGACVQHFSAFVGVAYQDSSLFFTYLLPSVRSWAAGDHVVDCIVTTTGQQLTSSVKGSRR